MFGNTPENSTRVTAVLLLVAGILVGLGAWSIPARWRSIDPKVLKEAGAEALKLPEATTQVIQADQLGVANLLLRAGRSAGLAHLEGAADAALQVQRRVPDMARLGGPDPILSQILPKQAAPADAAPQQAFDSFLPEASRNAVRAHLEASSSPVVQAILKSRQMPTREFVPVGKPGGQPLDAIILMTAMLHETGRLSSGLSQELRALGESVRAGTAADKLETAYLHILVLSRRLDWIALGELMRLMQSLAELEKFTIAVKLTPDRLPLLYSAAWLSKLPGDVARYIETSGTNGPTGLTYALRHGDSAVRWLLRFPAPVVPSLGPPALGADWVVRAPQLALALRWVLLFAAAALAASGMGCWMMADLGTFSDTPGAGWQHLFVTLVLGGMLIARSEPMLPRRADLTEYRIRLDSVSLKNSTSLAQTKSDRPRLMDISTYLSIAFFAAIQIAVYWTCLRKIREIDRLVERPLVKLRLMENEENLFDAGLYVGIAGTAAALVLQVLQVLPANLLAAYASNLMGIVGVAFVKIRHVRPYKRKLILQNEP